MQTMELEVKFYLQDEIMQSTHRLSNMYGHYNSEPNTSAFANEFWLQSPNLANLYGRRYK